MHTFDLKVPEETVGAEAGVYEQGSMSSGRRTNRSILSSMMSGWDRSAKFKSALNYEQREGWKLTRDRCGSSDLGIDR